jgi:uncharacterized damage-inducible protein DinB
VKQLASRHLFKRSRVGYNRSVMSTIETLVKTLQFHRTRTLGLLDRIDKHPRAREALGWRPGPGRAHLAWQLMHIAVTEELFATERLWPEKSGQFQELWPRFRGGSTPDDQIPESGEIRRVLGESREHLLDTLRRFRDDQLGVIPAAFKDRGMTLHEIVNLIAFHEAHHQGQGHLTFNLFMAASA